MIARLALALIGCLMVLWGVGMPLVAAFGSETSGQVTSIRRQLGDRGEAISNRYAYAIGYEFSLPDGTRVHGSTHRIGDYFSPKNIHKGQTVHVSYLQWLPLISDIDWQWFGAVEHLLVALVGGLLVYLQFKKSRLNRRSLRRVSRTRSKKVG